MKFRILLKSFDNDLINLASQQLRSVLLKTECNITGVVALPTKIKRFCVLRSPHVDKDSREHFELRLYKIFNEHEIPAGNSVFNNKSRIAEESVFKSKKRLYKRNSKCSRESLST